jgi:hypothetical protein
MATTMIHYSHDLGVHYNPPINVCPFYTEIEATSDLMGLGNNYRIYPSLEKQTGEFKSDIQNYYKPHIPPNGIQLYPTKQVKLSKKTPKCPHEGVEGILVELK